MRLQYLEIEAEDAGYTSGLTDIETNRWDGDNVIPPVKYMPYATAWYRGYTKAYVDTYNSHPYQTASLD